MAEEKVHGSPSYKHCHALLVSGTRGPYPKNYPCVRTCLCLPLQPRIVRRHSPDVLEESTPPTFVASAESQASGEYLQSLLGNGLLGASYIWGSFPTLKIEVIYSLETSVHIRTTRRYITKCSRIYS
jgi:hypothetical protein